MTARLIISVINHVKQGAQKSSAEVKQAILEITYVITKIINVNKNVKFLPIVQIIVI